MLRYIPTATADWLAIVHGDLALLVHSAGGEDVERYFSAISGGDIRSVLDALTSAGISATPAFGLVDLSTDTAHLFVRGECVVTLTTADGETVESSGAGVSTWTERFVEGAASFSIVADAGAGTELPIASGVVRSGRILSDGAPTPTPTPTPTPAPTVTPVAKPVEAAPPPPPAPLIAPPPAAPSLPAENTMVSPSGEEPEPEADPSTSANYSHLFEATIVRSVADAAVTPPSDETESPDPVTPVPPVARAGDHDGETVMSDSVSKLLAGRKRQTPGPEAAASVGPRLFVQLTNGTREPLGQPVIFGRSPSVSKVSGANIPRLVTLTGDDDISRNHVQVTVEGGTVVVTDLHSRNGTWVVAPGKPPQQLRKGEPTAVLVGTIVDLGNGSTLLVGQE